MSTPTVCFQHNCESTDADVSITDLSVSAKLVYKTLQHEGPLTQKEIIENAWIHDRTARYAIEDLRDADLIEEDVYVPDARQSLYEVSSSG